uniref:Uncharacterized protein n=1 Tax=Arundo donax TaxID=35708 RepID=A0A0A9H9C0_ARUDO
MQVGHVSNKLLDCYVLLTLALWEQAFAGNLSRRGSAPISSQ